MPPSSLGAVRKVKLLAIVVKMYLFTVLNRSLVIARLAITKVIVLVLK